MKNFAKDEEETTKQSAIVDTLHDYRYKTFHLIYLYDTYI
jgi:hypothetical protein